MHYQVTGQRIIAGGYQLFTASGFGANEQEAIADALATHPDRSAWQPHELRAEPDPINLAGLTIGTGAHVLTEVSLHGHRARAGATPAASSNLLTVERMSQGGVCQSSSRHHLHHAATKTATRGAIVVGIALAIESATKAADGGQPISPRTMGLDQTTGPAWVVIGADDPSPRRITGSARGESFSAGAGVVSVSEAGLKPPATSTGPADSISVASRKDETRSLAVAARSSLGLQPHEGNDGAVGNLGTDHSRQLPPTEFNVHPSTGFISPAGVPSRVGGVGNGNAMANDTPHPQAIAGGGAISPAVGGNRTDLHAKREPREETGYRVAVPDAPLGRLGQREQSALSDQPGGMPGTFSTHRLAWLAKAFAVSSVILTGIAAISAVMLAGRLGEE